MWRSKSLKPDGGMVPLTHVSFLTGVRLPNLRRFESGWEGYIREEVTKFTHYHTIHSAIHAHNA